MPELPEVETIRRDLEREFAGKWIKSVEVTGARSVRRQPAAELVRRTEGRQLVAVHRRGKYLLLNLDTGDTLVIHLGMSGQLLRGDPEEPPPKHAHVVLTLTGGTQLRFVDPRTFGEMFVAAPGPVEEQLPELAHLGFDPIDEQMAWTGFAARLAGRRSKLKPLLMDQRFVAGIGNLYADEILFNAGLRPDRISDRLTNQEIRRLHRAIGETLREAIEHRGSSLADEQYRDLFGEVGAFQRLHHVYDRAGQPCPRCGRPILRLKANGRSTFLCPQCQG